MNSWDNIESIFICSAIIIVTFLTIFGNLFVLFAFYNDPHLLTPSNNFILSMAIADFLVGLCCMPFYSVVEIKHLWPFGQLFCKIWLTIDDIATQASVLSIVAITIERYWSINHSVHYRKYTTNTRIRFCSLLIWLIPLINFAPGIWFLKPKTSTKNNINSTLLVHQNETCIGAYHDHTVYLIVAQFNFFVWPLILIIILNLLIVINLYKRSQRFPTLTSGAIQALHLHSRRRTLPSSCKHTYKQQSSKKPVINQVSVEMNQHPDSELEMAQPVENSHPILYENYIKYQNLQTVFDYCINSTKQLELQKDDRSQPEMERINVQMPPIIEMDEQSDHDSYLSTQKKKNYLDRLKQAQRLIKCERKNSIRKFSKPISKSKPKYSPSKSTQTLRQSFFTWRNTTMVLSPNSGEQHRTVRRLRRDKRAATSLLILVLVFMIFLLPYVVVVIGGRIFKIPLKTEKMNQIYSASFWLLWLNSTVNPFLYPFIQPRFRDAYKKLYKRLIHRRFIFYQ
ncbi:unnamed protein product [Didymodactylos carnosus]|uniref:G-protein coupled receptors family 1 profile domain-containing protein n=1 Tax=Didymodactylos carnosus TaxID=1234261 RepID=A0A814BNB1_9BILA|nr:unnamed protein product [Didymodactylos carnosus]CAF0929188.1 unnamed protein product [Didymodactylos carnosus]CAF3525195.1 unnamed protein product [Didymodactylos carnosus]CAF3707372.1 unnamed protein product [Didymodactylos carnosus]